jgi:hypothetical protein
MPSILSNQLFFPDLVTLKFALQFQDLFVDLLTTTCIIPGTGRRRSNVLRTKSLVLPDFLFFVDMPDIHTSIHDYAE